jgi:flagellar hook-associated protein 3 FlgL
MMGSFYPMTAGRTSNPQARFRMLHQLANDDAAIQNLQNQLSTGRRVLTPSDDLPATVRVLSVQGSIERKEQYKENLQTTQSFLGTTDNTLASIHDLLTEARGISISAVDSTLSDAQRDAIVVELGNSIDRLMQLGNSKFRDRYLFAGGNLKSQPFASTEQDGIVYRGDFNKLYTAVDYNQTIAINSNPQDAIGVLSSGIVSEADLNPGIAPNMLLADLNGGNGVPKGIIRLTNGVNNIDVDLSNANDLQDVMRQISSVTVGTRELTVSLNPNGLRINYADGFGGNLGVIDIGTGETAKYLGIRTSPLGTGTPLNGTDLNPILRPTTPLSQLNNGSGLALAAGFRIQQGNKTFNINTASATTVEDLFLAIKSSGANVVTEIAEGGKTIRIQSIESGVDLSIGENGGNLATALGIRTFAGTTQLSKLNYGNGIQRVPDAVRPDLVFTRSDGTSWELNLNGALTVNEVLDRINNSPNNPAGATKITASLAANGNGIVLTATPGAEPVTVTNGGGSQAAWDLGLVPRGSDLATLSASGGSLVLQGRDVSGQEVDGALNTLIKLKKAVQAFDLPEIERLTNLVAKDVDRMGLARGEIGFRQQRIDKLIILNEDQTISLKENASKDLDVDLAQAISDLQARQASMQASLNLIAGATKLSIWNYL